MEISPEEIEKRVKNSYELLNGAVSATPEPLVTVRTITYRQAPYIADCIEGVLMQKTDFPVEYVIGEDCSTDGTREVVIRYAEKYPQKIRVITADYNVGGLANAKRCNNISRGKYIALCEGDDYWTDPYKLQKQADFLETHPEYGLVYTDFDIFKEKNGEKRCKANSNLPNSNDISSKDELFEAIIARKMKISTLTVMFRRELLKKISANERMFLMGDTPLWLDLANITKFHYLDRVTGVYRIMENSASRMKNRTERLRFKLSSTEMRIYYCNKYKYPVPAELEKRYNQRLIDYLAVNPSYEPVFPLKNPSPYLKFILATAFFSPFACITKFIRSAGKKRINGADEQ